MMPPPRSRRSNRPGKPGKRRTRNNIHRGRCPAPAAFAMIPVAAKSQSHGTLIPPYCILTQDEDDGCIIQLFHFLDPSPCLTPLNPTDPYRLAVNGARAGLYEHHAGRHPLFTFGGAHPA
jgi:inorganic pyrophosphatase